jgi:hypothetical protein
MKNHKLKEQMLKDRLTIESLHDKTSLLEYLQSITNMTFKREVDFKTILQEEFGINYFDLPNTHNEWVFRQTLIIE